MSRAARLLPDVTTDEWMRLRLAALQNQQFCAHEPRCQGTALHALQAMRDTWADIQRQRASAA